MAKFETRLTFVQIGLGLAFTAALVQAARLQLLQGSEFAAEATRARTVREVLPARRGAIRDRNGVPLAITQEYYHIGVAPNEFRDLDAGLRTVARALAISSDRLRRDVRSGRNWIYYHGPFTAAQVEPLRALKGVHLEGEFARFYPARGLARPIIGVLDPDSAAGGSELELIDALEALNADGGDVVFLDPQSGEVLALASRQAGGSSVRPSTVSDPF